MTPAAYHRVVRQELDQLRREGLIDEATHADLSRRYPVSDWHWLALGRWFLVFGGIAVATGAAILAFTAWDFTLEKLTVLLAIATGGCFLGGWRLRHQPWVWSRRSLELLGSCGLIGLSFLLAILHSEGSDNWPAILLLDLFLLIPLAYVLRNVLILILSAVVFFVWFGGVTGYASGWGMYWFGMNYPARFLLAGLFIASIGVLHRTGERHWLSSYPGFFYVWLSAGVFFSEMSLWLMSVFGNFGAITADGHAARAGELLFFNLLWAGANVALLVLGARAGLRMLRGYAATFLILQGYTLFFRYVAGEIGAIASLFLAGGAALALVAQFERRRRSATSGADPG